MRMQLEDLQGLDAQLPRYVAPVTTDDVTGVEVDQPSICPLPLSTDRDLGVSVVVEPYSSIQGSTRRDLIRTLDVGGDVVRFDERRRLGFKRLAKDDATVGKGHRSDLQIHGVTEACVKFLGCVNGPWMEMHPKRWLATLIVARIWPDNAAVTILKVEKQWFQLVPDAHIAKVQP
jgi:hypothetical protein